MNRFGLLTAQKAPVPLKSIEVQLEVKDHVAAVVSTLNYENKEDKPLEAVFVFPLPGDAAVCHFSAQIAETHIVAEVKEKQQAQEEYDDALSSGQQAFLLEESDQSPDIFSLSVGSLPPGESASIRLEYVTELAVEADDGLRFCLPAVLNPRYQPQGSQGPSVQVTSVPASLVPYSLSFSARVSSPRPISKVESSCSLEPLQYLNTDQTQATVKLAGGHKFDRDVELLIYYKDAHQPTAVVEAGQASGKPGSLMGDPVVMVSLYPEFPQSVMSSLASCGEFVFLMDRSGSMDSRLNYTTSTSRMDSAKETLLLLLKSLPVGCYFNIYSFGSRFEHIFSESVKYNQKTMEDALKKVEKMEAEMGGTDILEPLKDIYSKQSIPSHPRQLFVFTDGEVGNTKDVIDLVRKNSDSHRCFSFGIGEGASSALISGIAKEGGGHAQFITGTERMQPKVMESLRLALDPAVVDISITWDLPKGMSATVLSPPIKSLFQGQRSVVYSQVSGKISEASEGRVKVKYSLAGHLSTNQLHFSLKPAEDTGLTVHRLAARTLIRSLEMKMREPRGDHKDIKKEVVQLSVQSGVSSSLTAFIAVNKAKNKAIQGPLVSRNVPTAKETGLNKAPAAGAEMIMLWEYLWRAAEKSSCRAKEAKEQRSAFWVLSLQSLFLVPARGATILLRLPRVSQRPGVEDGIYSLLHNQNLNSAQLTLPARAGQDPHNSVHHLSQFFLFTLHPVVGDIIVETLQSPYQSIGLAPPAILQRAKPISPSPKDRNVASSQFLEGAGVLVDQLQASDPHNKVDQGSAADLQGSIKTSNADLQGLAESSSGSCTALQSIAEGLSGSCTTLQGITEGSSLQSFSVVSRFQSSSIGLQWFLHRSPGPRQGFKSPELLSGFQRFLHCFQGLAVGSNLQSSFVGSSLHSFLIADLLNGSSEGPLCSTASFLVADPLTSEGHRRCSFVAGLQTTCSFAPPRGVSVTFGVFPNVW
ncbi:hypothetical protein CRENBAI_016814 [Crenichthys baileyi]|uniref:von Willebrand factor A domain-containing protein 5A n=1 Tax=Crenichthys baileyi TaxID=28760 RepID=A0AAV9REY0_9TELE